MQWQKLPETEFDLRLAGECAEAFSTATGLGCTISDSRGNVLGDIGGGYSTCTLCRLSGRRFACAEAHIYGMDEAERFGGRYIYFCPAGLTFFVSPIMDKLGSVAKITVGPFVMVAREDFDFLELRQYLGLEGEALRSARAIVDNIPYVSPDKVTALSTMLYMSVGFMSNVWSAEQMLKTRDSDAIQSAIGEYIFELKNDGAEAEYPYQTEKRLTRSITTYDKAQAGEALNELLGHIFFASGGDIERIKVGVYDLLVLMSRAAVDGGARAERTVQQNYAYLRQLQAFRSMDSLCLWLTKTMNSFMDTTFGLRDVKHVDVIYKTIGYLRDHFDEKLTVDSAAANVYLSPSYFSKLFKQEMGESFGSYLNRFRIEKSKELLRQERYKLIDIAVMVGFEDQSYFTKVFKRVSGVSPNRYRESLGRVEQAGEAAIK